MQVALLASVGISILLLSTAIFITNFTEDASALRQEVPIILIETHKTPSPSGLTINQPYMEDAIRVTSDNQRVAYNRIFDTACDRFPHLKLAAHRDAVQVIPKKDQWYNYQMMGGRLDNTQIIGNIIQSNCHLQGVFSSDGTFSNLVIQNNQVMTESQHQVTINGMLSGKISGNTNLYGQPVRVSLGPLRIGGNLFTGNIWILGFNDSSIRYEPLASIVLDNSPVQDTRTLKTRSYDINLVEFRYTSFFQFLETTKLSQIMNTESWNSRYVKWIRNLESNIGVEHIDEARINRINAATKSEADRFIYQIRSTDLLMFALQEASLRFGRMI